jgi:ribonuclease BN (tRNA processing enzyme)
MKPFGYASVFFRKENFFERCLISPAELLFWHNAGMKSDRREFLSITTGSFLLSLLPEKANAQQNKRTRLILLGTSGGPRVRATGRSNSSTLILINNIPYVIDCGYGASKQVLAAGVAHDRLRYIFCTHLHSDHSIEYGTLFYNAWVTGLPVTIETYGPPGLEKMTRDFFSYMRIDIDTRIVDEGRLDPRKMIAAHDIAKAGPVMQNDDVKVSCILVPHPMIKHAFAYRFDAKDRSIVISGDTAYSLALADFAKGADVLVHEVMYLPRIEALVERLPNATRLRQHLLASHTVPEDVGRVAARAGVKTLVLSHFVPGDDPTITDEMWSEGVRKNFGGQIIVGRDLLEI